MKPLHFTVTTILSALCLSSALAESGKHRYLQRGMGIVSANQLILRDGWIADPAKITRTYPMTGFRKQIYDRGVTAIEDCATDISTCTFKYRKQDACLQVFAKGESLKALKISEWDNDCEPEP